MTNKTSYIDPNHSVYLEDKIRRYEKYTETLEGRLEKAEKLLGLYRQFIVQSKLTDKYTAWRVANRITTGEENGL